MQMYAVETNVPNKTAFMPVAEVQLQLQSTFCIEIAGLVPALILAKASRLGRPVCPGLNTGQYTSLQIF